MRSVVVFPPPFAPTRPKTSPACSVSASFSTATRCPYRFVTSSTATRVLRARTEVSLFPSVGSAMDIGEPSEHVLCRLCPQGEHARPRLEARPQFGESQPNGRGACVAHTLGVDEYASRLDPKIGTEKRRHTAVRLMRDEVVYRVNRYPQRARDRSATIEQLGSAGP